MSTTHNKIDIIKPYFKINEVDFENLSGSVFTDHLMECDFKWRMAKPVIKPYTPFCWIHQLEFSLWPSYLEGMKAYKDDQDAVWLLDLMKTINVSTTLQKNGNARVPEDVLWKD
jgi:hypothetical protein